MRVRTGRFMNMRYTPLGVHGVSARSRLVAWPSASDGSPGRVRRHARAVHDSSLCPCSALRCLCLLWKPPQLLWPLLTSARSRAQLLAHALPAPAPGSGGISTPFGVGLSPAPIANPDRPSDRSPRIRT